MDVYASWFKTIIKEKFNEVLEVKKGYPTKKFWDDWKLDKEKMKSEGYILNKSPDGKTWILVHFRKLTQKEVDEYLERKTEKKKKVINNDTQFVMKDITKANNTFIPATKSKTYGGNEYIPPKKYHNESEFKAQ
jgi:hypothetical protein